MRAIFLVALALATMRESTAESLKLTKENFNETIAKSEIFLVKFYVDTCGYCQMLAPEWEKAANETIDNALMGEVDCHSQPELAANFSIRGYPTIILFRNGKEAEHYGGARTKDDIIKYIKANVGPAVTPASNAEEVTRAKEEHDVVCVGLTASNSTSLSTTLAEAAQSFRVSLKFFEAEPKLFPDEKPETIVVYRKGGEKEVYDGPMEVEKLTEFLQISRVAFGGEITPENYQYYSVIKRPVGWAMVKPNETASIELKESLTEVGKKMRSHMVVLWVNISKHPVWRDFGVPEDAKYPAFLAIHWGANYLHSTAEVVTRESLEKFILEFAAGRVEPTIKSLPVPEVETVDGKTTIVAKTMQKHLTSGKDMLILFFAPWCGHCKNFAPTFDKIAKEFDATDLIVAELDATANYVNSSTFTVTAFPTVFFVPNGGKPVVFEGERSFENVYEFVRKHVTTFKVSEKPANVTEEKKSEEENKSSRSNESNDSNESNVDKQDL
ncbi:bloodstream-specific protein 2 precursor [Trypanosoma equiperdum]|uniref:Protein disulfide isomerase n=2 Tax=Trypanozoon TaxID=39700 RepID=Q38AE1_TRYB2|nr:protein disulfide isomerase [Trypanosoma brucei brucei TREU927]EAN78229.1 protein disulfide isomerase [Trypanosoma brucei brucei TREU927]SCU70107.1 bloodstream-specific protein 2 precursor [Trypanosoma equiperdum]